MIITLDKGDLTPAGLKRYESGDAVEFHDFKYLDMHTIACAKMLIFIADRQTVLLKNRYTGTTGRD